MAEANSTGGASWDWVAVLVVAVGVILLLVITREVWVPHPFPVH